MVTTQGDLGAVYPLVAWLAWVPNMIVAKLVRSHHDKRFQIIAETTSRAQPDASRYRVSSAASVVAATTGQ